MQINLKKPVLIAALQFSFGFIAAQSFGQVEEVTSCGQVIEKKKQQGDVYDMVDEPASFPGGFSALRTFLAKNLVYPREVSDSTGGYVGKYYVKFIVDKDGTCRDFGITKVAIECLGCDKEVLRVLKRMPRWKPGLVAGEPVSSWYHIPVTFGPK